MAAPRQDSLGSIGLLILRLGAGGLLLYGHGWGKLMDAAARSHSFANPIGLGPERSFWLVVFAEVFYSAFVMLGFLTRLSCVPLVIFFTVAGFIPVGFAASQAGRLVRTMIRDHMNGEQLGRIIEAAQPTHSRRDHGGLIVGWDRDRKSGRRLPVGNGLRFAGGCQRQQEQVAHGEQHQEQKHE